MSFSLVLLVNLLRFHYSLLFDISKSKASGSESEAAEGRTYLLVGVPTTYR